MSKPTAKNSNAPVEGTLDFIQHNLPGLASGEYQLKVSQRVSAKTSIPGEQFDNSYYFAVRGERFTLDPRDLTATYPPDQAEGEFNNSLPHVVLTKQTLPWMRFPTIEKPPVEFEGIARATGEKPDRDAPTWLAVLLLDEDDSAAMSDRAPGFSLKTTGAKVRDLFNPRRPGWGTGYSYFYHLDSKRKGDSDYPDKYKPEDLNHHLDYGETISDSCRTIDLPLKLFWRIAPSVDDLKMMAHVRSVVITKKATRNGVPASRNDLSNVPGASNFAIVLGNRLPQVHKRSLAFLVSLEGLEHFLPVDAAGCDSPDETHPPPAVFKPDPKAADGITIDSNGFLRLVCLKSWSFTSTGDGNHFKNTLKALNPKVLPAEIKGTPNNPNPSELSSRDFSIGLPAPAPQSGDSSALKQAKNALSMGYTGLAHHTRDGGRTVSWYRGPLQPYPTKPDPRPPTFPSADAATRYDPDNGMFDVSYAAAWQIGRLLGLQNKQYAASLYNFRRGNLRAVVSRMETIITRQSLDDIQSQLCNDDLIHPLLKCFLPDAAANTGPSPTDARLPQGKPRTARQHAEILSDSNQISQALEDQLKIPREIYTWLARLKLLDGLPFEYMLPDERMLPPESLRFFYVDMNWVHALLDGALSIGRHAAPRTNTAEYSHDRAVKPDALSAAGEHARVSRGLALDVEIRKDPSPLETVSGFLLRSGVVAGWPGLEVNAYDDVEDGELLDIVRFERLAPTVLLCLVEGGLKRVDIHEPAEGLHFGFANQAPPAVNLRYNYKKDDIFKPGRQAPGVNHPAPFRKDGKNRLVRMFRLSKALYEDPKYAAYIHNIDPVFDHLPSSEFALEMIKGVGMVHFNFKEPSDP